MRQKIWTRILAVAAATLLAAGPTVAVGQDREAEADSSLVDLLTSDGLTRGELARLYEAVAGGGQTPPDCVTGEEMFDDVPASNLFCPWIEELARRGITGGCNPDNYCPNDPVSRSQMAVFIVRAIDAATQPDVVLRAGEPQVVEAGELLFRGVACEPGEVATGGGVRMPLLFPEGRLVASHPHDDPFSPQEPTDGTTPTGWRVGYHSTGPSDLVEFTPYVVCARP